MEASWVKVLFLNVLMVLNACSTIQTSTVRETAQLVPAPSETTSIHSVYLTWQDPDTSSTMVINYVAFKQAQQAKVFYGLAENQKDQMASGQYRDIPGTPYNIYSFPLTGLKRNTEYHFQVSDEANGTSRNYKFRTLTDDDTPIEIIVGGDMGAIGDIPDYAKAAITDQSRAILIGGDIAYDSGELKNHKLWTKWFTLMNRSMFTPDGHILPLVLAMGNHEANTKRRSKKVLDNVPFFFTLFYQNEYLPYFVNYFGKHTVLLTLDSGHWASHSGDQLKWLEEQLNTYQRSPNLLAMYHAPLYPSARDFNNSFSALGRKHWQPLFDKYQLDMAFENHDHALKRTKLLKGGKEVGEDGVVYIGDGCWGQGARGINTKAKPYFEVLKNQRHLWRLTLAPHAIHAIALDKMGGIHDNFEVLDGKVTTLKAQ